MHPKQHAPAWLLSTMLAAAPAGAQTTAPTPAEDVVTLRDGSVLRGRAREVRVDESVVLMLPSGETRAIPWPQVTSATGPSFQPTAAPPAAPAAPPPPPPETAADLEAREAELATEDFRRPAPGRVPLVVESPDRVQVVGVTLSVTAVGTGVESQLITRHRELCRTPCTLYVRPGAFPLYTGGLGVVEATSDLAVPPHGARVQVHAPSETLTRAYTMAGGVSLALMLGGIAVAGLGDFLGNNDAVVGGLVTGLVAFPIFLGSLALSLSTPSGVRSLTPLAPGATARAPFGALVF
jgi:hypothetical protein